MREYFWFTLSCWLPRTLVKHALIRAFAHATTGPYSSTLCSGVTCAEVLKRWQGDGK